MNLVLVAARAVLLPLHALRMQALVLRGEIISVFALAAGENDFLSWHCRQLLWCGRASGDAAQPTARRKARALRPAAYSTALSNSLTFAHQELAIGIEPMTSPLPRVCSTN